MVFVGVDVGSKSLVVAVRDGVRVKREEFTNTPGGCRKLCVRLPEGEVRVAVEATGFYSLDVCMALRARANTEVMVANPRAVAHFTKAMMRRAKTDEVDAVLLAEFAERMPFVPWEPPSAVALELRGLSRRIHGLVKLRTMEKNRLKSAEATAETSALLLEDMRDSIEHLDARIERLRRHATALIDGDEQLAALWGLLLSIPGVGPVSGVQILGELVCLPADMGVRQWVAHAGLDPRPWRSGTSVNRATRISKAGNQHLRQALFMPALVAVRRNATIRAYYEHLISDAGLKPIQAVVAVMRKLLHAAYGMFRTRTEFESERFYRGAA